jgi:hypothetical protein
MLCSVALGKPGNMRESFMLFELLRHTVIDCLSLPIHYLHPSERVVPPFPARGNTEAIQFIRQSREPAALRVDEPIDCRNHRLHLLRVNLRKYENTAMLANGPGAVEGDEIALIVCDEDKALRPREHEELPVLERVPMLLCC